MNFPKNPYLCLRRLLPPPPPLKRRRTLLILLTVAGCSFWLGRLIATLSTMTLDSFTTITTTMAETPTILNPRHDNYDDYDYYNHHHHHNSEEKQTTLVSLLSQQIMDQAEFQSMIYASQNPPPHSDSTTSKTDKRRRRRQRYLVLDEIPTKDGFASEFQYMTRLLQTAMSTDRTLVVTKEWKSEYCPNQAATRTTASASAAAQKQQKQRQQRQVSTSISSGGWTCLWQPITNSTSHSTPRQGSRGNASSSNKENNQTIVLGWNDQNPLTFAVLPKKHQPTTTTSDSTLFFDPLPYYGHRPMVQAPVSFPLKHTRNIDTIPHWERAHGRYWIRSQIAHYLWRPSEWLQNEINHRMASILLPSPPTPHPFIGMHVRLTDNIPDFAKSFGRNATHTRRLERFRTIAERIWKTHFATTTSTKTVFIATDHAHVLEWAQGEFLGWKILFQQHRVQRATTQQRTWFAEGRSTAAGAMATDVEILRRADFLIGSYQSNVFRLATQLNTAWHVQTYSIRMPRHFSVDVEWFEDP